MRRRFKFALLFSLYFFLLSVPAKAFEHPLLRCIENISVLETRENYSIDDVIRRNSSFRPIIGGTIRLWDTRDTLWLKIPVHYLKQVMEKTSQSNIIIILQSEYIAQVHFYLPTTSGTYKKMAHGLELPFENRILSSRFPAFKLRDYDLTEGYIYINIKTNLPISFHVLMANEENFYHKIIIKNLTHYMAFYSFLGALALSYLFFYLMTGNKGYAFSALRQLGIWMFIFSLNGYLQYYLLLTPRTVYGISWFGLILYATATFCFWKYLLQLRSTNFWLGLLRALQFIAISAMALTVFWEKLELTIAMGMLAITIEFLYTLIFACISYRQGTHRIILFVISRTSSFIGFIFLFIDMFFISKELYQYAFMIGLILDPIFLAYMLIPSTRTRLENYLLLEKKSERFEMLSQRDSMTGLYNKANLLLLLEDKLKQISIAKGELSFIMLDIDHFKKFNDTWGHLEGDRALLFLSKTIQNNLREHDIAARYGGEEFSIILPGVTLKIAMIVAERIRTTCETESHTLGRGKAFTVSLGISSLQPEDDITSLIRRADGALYCAKSKGRNRTETEQSACAVKNVERFKPR